MTTKQLHFKWTVSRGRDTYGYNICTLLVDGYKVAKCNGGGYDMQGTCLGDWLARAFPDRLNKLKIPMNRRNGEDVQEYYGLTYHDPTFDPGNAIPDHPGLFENKPHLKGKTVKELEAMGESLGLDRYQQFYKASSPFPTERHTVPLIDGACGFSSVERIANAIGITLQWNPESNRYKNHTYYTAIDTYKS